MLLERPNFLKPPKTCKLEQSETIGPSGFSPITLHPSVELNYGVLRSFETNYSYIFPFSFA